MKTRYWIGLSAVDAAAAVMAARKQRHAVPRTYVLNLPAGGEGLPSDSGSVEFIGTATMLIRFADFTVLTDPNFLHRGERIHVGYGMHATRLTDPSLNFEDLPPVDFVVLSHMHEDHFDKLVQERLAKGTPILTTASAARTLLRRGFRRLYGLNTWDTVEVRKGSTSLKVTSMPGTHGPLLVSSMLPDVMGSMLEFQDGGNEYRMYVSGDTLVYRDLHEIPARYPGVDLALLHLGGTRVMGILVTMDAKHGVQALRIIDPDLAIPVHYNDYDLFKSSLEEFKAAVDAAGLQDKVHYLQHGETYSFAARGAGAPAIT